MATTFYLKYRPQTFQELDSTEARTELEKTFKSGKIPHAFLFSGPRGIGKTSAARIVAKAVNCQKTQNYEPCNKCSSCLSITSGTNLDVLEIDAASNRGIDDIKELREKIKLSPASSKYKVYIIDEVHMLTTEAFNALLKTLEEPPAHAIFVLCTTDPEKLPKTIISRCQRINFKRGSKSEILARLKKICETEGYQYDEKALEQVVRLADGGFRDAVKILGQTASEGKVSLEEVQKTVGISGELGIDDFLINLKERQTKEALLWLNQAVEKGINLRVLLESLLEKLRQQLLYQFGVGEDESGEKINLTTAETQLLIALFGRAYFELKSAVIPQLPIEMAIIEWSSFAKASEDKGGTSGEKEVRSGSGSEKREEKKTVEEEPASAGSSINFEAVLAKWPEILAEVKPLNHSVLAFLKACRPLACEGNFLILEVFYKFHKDQLETDKCRKIFEKSASEVLGCPVKMKCHLREIERPVKPLPQVEEVSFSPPKEIKKATKVVESGEDDIIKFAEEIFNKEGGTIQ